MVFNYFSVESLMELLLVIIFLENFFVLALWVGTKAFNSYRQTKATGTFFFALSVVTVAFAIILLLCERLVILFLFELGNLAPAHAAGLLFAQVAMGFGFIAITSIAIFAFNVAFSKVWKILAVIATLLLAVYYFFWYYGPITWIGPPGFEFEILPSDIANYLLYGIYLPMLIIPAAVFFYFAVKVRSDSPRQSRMSVFMGLGLLCFFAASAIELVGLLFPYSLIGRFIYIPAILFYYWGLFRVKGEK